MMKVLKEDEMKVVNRNVILNRVGGILIIKAQALIARVRIISKHIGLSISVVGAEIMNVEVEAEALDDRKEMV
jgi:hypothetical protein